MSQVRIIIPGIVVPKQSMRVKSIAYFNQKINKCDSFIQTYQKKEVTDYEEKVRICAMEQLGAGFAPWEGAIEINIDIIYKVPTGMSTKDKNFIAQGGIIYKITLPDLTDNLIKGICDGLQGKAYVNDGQICKTSSTKVYGLYDKAIVTLTQIERVIMTKSFI